MMPASSIFLPAEAGGTEIDFIVNHIDCAIECKATRRAHDDHLKSLRQLGIEHPEVKRRIIVSLDQKNHRTEDGIDIVGYHEFLRLLWEAELFQLDLPPNLDG
jgi:predicted AAA+ superfamily ATPase